MARQHDRCKTGCRAFGLLHRCYGRYATATARIGPRRCSRVARCNRRTAHERKFDLWADWVLACLPLVRWRFGIPPRRGRTRVVCPPAAAGFTRVGGRSVATSDQQAMQRCKRRTGTSSCVVQRPTVAGCRAIERGLRRRRSAICRIDRRPALTIAATLAQQGRLPEAIAAYDETLRAAPGDADAAFNKALLEKLLQQQQQQSGKEGQESQRNRDDTNSEQSREQQSAENQESRESQSQRADAAQKAPDIKQQETDEKQKPQADDGKEKKA